MKVFVFIFFNFAKSWIFWWLSDRTVCVLYTPVC